MFNISHYLEKFKKIEPKGDSVKYAVHEAIFETLGVRVEKRDISIKDNTLHISVPASLKNEIFMNKQRILQKAQKNTGIGSVVDIR